MRPLGGISIDQALRWAALAALSLLGGWLLDKYKIVSTPIGHPEFTGLRVTPNVYTTLDEVDTFIAAMREAIRKGVA